MGLDFVYNQPSTRITSRNAEQPKDLKKLRNDGNKEVKKGVLISCLRPATLLKKGIWYRCFPVNFAKFQRIPLLQNTSGQLPLFPTFANYFVEDCCFRLWILDCNLKNTHG